MVIEESFSGVLTIEPDEDEEIRASADKIMININPSLNDVSRLGQRVIVTYIGDIMELYPAQVKVIEVQFYEDDFIIVEEIAPCADALEFIYEDDNYRYYFPCIKSHLVFIEFTDKQKKILVKEAIEENHFIIYRIIAKYPNLFYKEAK